jgi:hypothetical protein
MKRGAKIHYRVFGPPGQRRILAYGCGHSGAGYATTIEDWSQVTCNACKRTAEWKEAAGLRPTSATPEKGK